MAKNSSSSVSAASGLLGSDTNFAAVLRTAPSGRAEGSANLGSDPKNPLPASYEAALQELEALVASLESGQLPLDQLLTGYQRGAQLLKFCRDKLEAVETQIKVLEGTELKPWGQE